MRRLGPLLGLIGIPALLAVPAFGEWRNSSSIDFEAETNQRHPRSGEITIVMPVDGRFGGEVCFGYGNLRKDRPNKGRIAVVVEVSRQESPTGPVLLVDRQRIPTTRVTENVAGECAGIGIFQAGDIFTFSFTFRGLPGLRPNVDAGRFQYLGSVTSRDCTEGDCVSAEP